MATATVVGRVKEDPYITQLRRMRARRAQSAERMGELVDVYARHRAAEAERRDARHAARRRINNRDHSHVAASRGREHRSPACQTRTRRASSTARRSDSPPGEPDPPSRRRPPCQLSPGAYWHWLDVLDQLHRTLVLAHSRRGDS
jgi:hypothetical protein